MPGRKLTILIAAAFLAAFTASASEFWVTKDWKQWSKDECTRVLVESPWAQVWRGRIPGVNPMQEPMSVFSERGQTVEYVVYCVQIRSALPIREAIVRQTQLEQKYDQMTDAQRNAFDVQARQVLNRKYDDVILIHVDFSKGKAATILARDRGVFVQKGVEDLDAYLETDDGSRVTMSRFDMNPNGLYSFDLVFPRNVNGVPSIKDGQKRLAVQFTSPELIGVFDYVNIPRERVRVEFDLSKMSLDGKPSF